MFCVATVLAGLCLNAAVVTTLDGKQYEGEAFLEPGNVVTVVLPDSSKRSIPLDQVKSATFSGLMSTDTFGQIAEGWSNADVGDVTITGVAGQSNSLFAVQVGSGDIGDRNDSFHYVYVPAAGDVDIVARVVSISGVDRLARAGIMFRDSLRPEAKFVFAGINADGEAALQYRGDTGKATPAARSMPVTLPVWIKVSRHEKNFTAFQSVDGRDWQELGLVSIGLKDNCYVGLAVASHSALSFCRALISDVTRTVRGVRGEYFADMDFGQLFTNRIDPIVSFFWDGTPPVEGAPANNYSARWTGEFEPNFSESYLFHADAGDARLWINGEEVNLSMFRPNMPAGRQTNVANSAPLSLKAGNRYPFRFEFRHTSGRASVRFGWSSSSQSKEPIQPRHLFCHVEARAQPAQRPAVTTNAWTIGRGILLRNGTFLSGAVRSISPDGVKFTHRGEKEYTVPLHQVARAVFRIGPRNALLGNPGLAQGALLGNGDFIEGRLQFGHGHDVKVSSVLFGLKGYNLDDSDLAALVFGGPSAGAARYELRMADNSIVMAKTISVAPEQVEIVEPLLGALQVPRDAVTELRGIEQRADTVK
jgi:hypothetical protein